MGNSLMTGARLSFDAAMRAAQGIAAGKHVETLVVQDTTWVNDRKAYHVSDQRPPPGGRYRVCAMFDSEARRADYMGPRTHEETLPREQQAPAIGPATSKAESAPVLNAANWDKVEASVHEIDGLKALVLEIVEDLRTIKVRQSVIDVDPAINTLLSAHEDLMEAVWLAGD